MKLAIRHTLTFDLDTPARAVQHLLLAPRATPQQQVLRWSVDLPGAGEADFTDAFGNAARIVNQARLEGPIAIVAAGLVETCDRAGVLGRLEREPPPAVFCRPSTLAPADPALTAEFAPEAGRIALLHQLMDRLAADEPVVQIQADGMQSQSAPSTASRAHRLIGTLRALRIPARYVTGYLFEAGAGRRHDWVEAWDEGLGWIGLDPEYNICPTEAYVRLAVGFDASSIPPIRSVPGWTAPPEESVEISEISSM